MAVFKKIGETFKKDLVNLVVVEDERQDIKSCKGCAALHVCGIADLPHCVKDKRKDKKNIHFKITE